MTVTGSSVHRGASRRRTRLSSTIHGLNKSTSTSPSTSSSSPSPSSTIASSRRLSRSPSRCTSINHPIGPPRALRLLRVLLYSLAAPNFLYSMYVQLVVLKGPGRTPLPASVNFGRDSLFLTFHANFHCTWYFCLCFLHSILSLGRRRSSAHLRRGTNTSNTSTTSTTITNTNTTNIRATRRSYAARTVEVLSHRPTAILFPLACFVGVAYYSILHFHPLNRLRAQLVPDHDSKMALLHLNPLLFVLADSFLKDTELFARHGLKKAKATRAIIAYGVGYFIWTAFCVRLNGGHWPYPFQKSFSVVQHFAFVLASSLSAAYLCRAGFRLHGRLDRRRRKRLAATSERQSLSSNHSHNANSHGHGHGHGHGHHNKNVNTSSHVHNGIAVSMGHH